MRSPIMRSPIMRVYKKTEWIYKKKDKKIRISLQCITRYNILYYGEYYGEYQKRIEISFK